jgi:hypothetical protein
MEKQAREQELERVGERADIEAVQRMRAKRSRVSWRKMYEGLQWFVFSNH